MKQPPPPAPLPEVKEHLPDEKDNSHTFLGLGVLSGFYGGFTKLTAGYFCPACLLLTPLLLGIGLWKKRLARLRRSSIEST